MVCCHLLGWAVTYFESSFTKLILNEPQNHWNNLEFHFWCYPHHSLWSLGHQRDQLGNVIIRCCNRFVNDGRSITIIVGDDIMVVDSGFMCIYVSLLHHWQNWKRSSLQLWYHKHNWPGLDDQQNLYCNLKMLHYMSFCPSSWGLELNE